MAGLLQDQAISTWKYLQIHNGARFESGVHGGYAQEGPTVTISGETDNGWDFHMTLDRNLESSQDPAIPGRPGDVILGGGFEIVYVRSDKVDFQSDDFSLFRSGSNHRMERSKTNNVRHDGVLD